jgi:predicted ATP-dependent serine protease
MEHGSIKQLEGFLEGHPDTRLIVIDVLQRILVHKAQGNAYTEDYDVMKPLHELARARGITVLGIHHTRQGGQVG